MNDKYVSYNADTVDGIQGLLSREQKLFPLYMVSMFLIRRFQLIRHCISSPDSSLSDKSFGLIPDVISSMYGREVRPQIRKVKR